MTMVSFGIVAVSHHHQPTNALLALSSFSPALIEREKERE